MKILFLSLTFSAFIFTAFVSAQSVTITRKSTTYTRPKPIADFKTTFTISYPKVDSSSPALSRRIESSISYSKILGLNVQEEIRDVQWLEEADYEVTYNKNGILTIMLSMHGAGAYPSGTSRHVVVNLASGNRVEPADVFTNLTGLAKIIKNKQIEEITKASSEIKSDPENGDVDSRQLFLNTDFTVKELDEFAVMDTGVRFIYDYGFPHVIQALQPEGSYFFTWTQLKPYIKRNGLLGRFVR